MPTATIKMDKNKRAGEFGGILNRNKSKCHSSLSFNTHTCTYIYIILNIIGLFLVNRGNMMNGPILVYIYNDPCQKRL